MLEHSFQSLISFLHAHPHWGSVCAFAISLIESLALIGTIVPGSLTMTGIGALIGAGVLPGTTTFVWAIAGAYSGDMISYWVGIHYNERLRNIWPFNTHGKWLKRGEDFFRKHGGKSVVIGRFVGPIRSLIPLIAGLLKMPPSRFLGFALISATLWALVYMLPGVLLGSLALELPPKVATQFVLLCLLAIALLWGIIWVIKYFIQTCREQVDRLFMRMWNYLNTHQHSHWITQLLRNPSHAEDHMQLALAVSLLITLGLFLWIMVSVLTHGFLTHINAPIYDLLQSFRIKSLDHFAIAVTLLGYGNLLILVAVILVILLLWKRHHWAAWHLLAVTLLSAVATEVIKRLVHEPRPPLVLETIHSGAFPSGHTTLSTAIFGFLAMIIAHHLPDNLRRLPFRCVIGLVAAIAFSRIYLGAHWVTDVLGGIFLGLSCALLITLSYCRRTPSAMSPGKFSLTVLILFLVAWSGVAVFGFRSFQEQFNPPVPTQTISSLNAWWQQTPGQLPVYRQNRIGSPSQPLNVQWLGSLTRIEQVLTQEGWEGHTAQPNLHRTILRFAAQSPQENFPLMPGLYHNRNPELLMTKSMGADQPTLTLRLWQSDILVKTDDSEPLWIGTVQYYWLSPKLLHIANHQQKVDELQNTIRALIPYLKNFQWQVMQVPADQQPKVIQRLHWSGKVLLIKDKTLVKDKV